MSFNLFVKSQKKKDKEFKAVADRFIEAYERLVMEYGCCLAAKMQYGENGTHPQLTVVPKPADWKVREGETVNGVTSTEGEQE